MSEAKTRYKGGKVNVDWDSRLCIHIGECGHSEGDLFVAGRDPWCQPDLTSPDDVMDVVKRCPSGALSYDSPNASTAETAAIVNKITVTYNGSCFISGDLDIEGAADDMPGVAFRAALCRCVASNNKPFCDGSHNGIGFKSEV